MHGNDVHQIPDGTFGDLISLQVHFFPLRKHLCTSFVVLLFAIISHIFMKQLLQ